MKVQKLRVNNIFQCSFDVLATMKYLKTWYSAKPCSYMLNVKIFSHALEISSANIQFFGKDVLGFPLMVEQHVLVKYREW